MFRLKTVVWTTAVLLAVASMFWAMPAQAALIADFNMEQSASPLSDQSGNGYNATANAGGGFSYSQASAAAGTYGSLTLANSLGYAAGVSNTASQWNLATTDSNLDSITNNVTVMSWIYVPTLSGLGVKNATILGTNLGGQGINFGITGINSSSFYINFTKLGVADYNVLVNSTNVSGVTIGDGQWYNIAVTASSTGGLKAYVDGNAVTYAGSSYTNNLIAVSGANYYDLGCGSGSTAKSLDAEAGIKVDEVRVYNDVESQSQIQADAILGQQSASATIAISTTSVTLDTVIKGAASPSANISAHESAGAAGNYNIGAVSGGGNIAVANAGSTNYAIAANATNNHAVTYADTNAVGSVSGTIQFTSGSSGTVTGSPVTVNLSGLILDHASASVTTANFGNVLLGANVANQSTVLSNASGNHAGLQITSLGDLSGSTTLIAAGGSRTLTGAVVNTSAYNGAYNDSHSITIEDDTAYNGKGATPLTTQVFHVIGNVGEATAASNSFGTALTAALNSGDSLVGLASRTGVGSGGPGSTEALLKAGTASSNTTVGMAWETAASAPTTPSIQLVSDVVNLAGALSADTKLQMSYSGIGNGHEIYLAQLEGTNNWVRVTTGAGVDLVNHLAYATVGGAGTFAVVPEPGTLALLATGLIGLLAYAWRKRK